MSPTDTPHLAPDLLSGKSILITGGGTGLGLAMGLAFAGLGAEIDVCGRRAEVLDTAADRLREAGAPRIGTHVCDIRDADAVVSAGSCISPSLSPSHQSHPTRTPHPPPAPCRRTMDGPSASARSARGHAR